MTGKSSTTSAAGQSKLELMRILSWNILQGCGKRAADIADAIVKFKPDIALLQEFRNGKSAGPILDACRSLALSHTHISNSETRKNTVMIASKYAMECRSWDHTLDSDLAVDAMIDLQPTMDNNTANNNLRLLVSHLPQKKAQVPYLDTLYRLPIDTDAYAMIIGDLNCGIPFEDSDTKSFVNTHIFQSIIGKGWIDSWRSRNKGKKEFSWVSSRGNGYRYDHALCSQLVDSKIKNIWYEHSVRENKLSDHSALLIDIEF